MTMHSTSLRAVGAGAAALMLLGGAVWLLAPEWGGGWGSLTVWLRLQQMGLQKELADAVRQARDGGVAAAWPLIAVSFLYGVAHAAGPGHGKAIVAAYVLADGRRLRRGLALAWASAMLQGAVAVALIGAATWMLGVTARQAQEGTVWLERAGYALIFGVGLTMLHRGWRKLRGDGDLSDCGHAHEHRHDCGRAHHGHEHHGHAHHEHEHHEHDAACGHVPAPSADPADWRETAVLLLSVGLRPCSGALLALTFASSLGVFSAGIAAAFAMAVGTAITVSCLAALAAGSRRLALAAAKDGRRPAQIENALILASGLALAAMGAAFLAGSFAPGPAMPFR